MSQAACGTLSEVEVLRNALRMCIRGSRWNYSAEQMERHFIACNTPGARVRLVRHIKSELPFLSDLRAEPGVYEPEINPLGAVSIKTEGGSLGLRLDEFEWVMP